MFYRPLKNKKGGTRYYSLNSNQITRDTSSRKKLSESLNKAIANKARKLSERFEEAQNDDETDEIIELNEVVEILKSTDESLSSSSISQLKKASTLISELVTPNDPKYFQGLEGLFEAVVNNESRKEPSDEISDILWDRLPEFLLFGEKERMLKSSYQLDEEGILEDVALNNLMETAGLPLKKLKNEIDGGDEAEVERLRELANEKLKQEFEAWKQEDVYPVIKFDDYRLTILFGKRDKGGYDNIAKRSDGLRQFVALFTFIKSKNTENDKILLIDEAETHLHYDAQADFIQMLAKQDIVKKIIYTTHSMGCLPEDLGGGVRFIQRIKEEERHNASKIVNWFWTNNRPGFSSVLFGMGATTLAFIPLRHALFTEGPIDFLLLPALMKEALEKDHLGFLVTPRIAEATEKQITAMDHESLYSAYLVDSDHGKGKLKSMLIRAGIDEKRIFYLPERKKKGLAIEDLIDKNIYLEAEDIPDHDRANAVKKKCKNYNQPSKRDVALCLLEMKTEGKNILSQDMKSPLKKIVLSIGKTFKENI